MRFVFTFIINLLFASSLIADQVKDPTLYKLGKDKKKYFLKTQYHFQDLNLNASSNGISLGAGFTNYYRLIFAMEYSSQMLSMGHIVGSMTPIATLTPTDDPTSDAIIEEYINNADESRARHYSNKGKLNTYSVLFGFYEPFWKNYQFHLKSGLAYVTLFDSNYQSTYSGFSFVHQFSINYKWSHYLVGVDGHFLTTVLERPEEIVGEPYEYRELPIRVTSLGLSFTYFL